MADHFYAVSDTGSNSAVIGNVTKATSTQSTAIELRVTDGQEISKARLLAATAALKHFVVGDVVPSTLVPPWVLTMGGVLPDMDLDFKNSRYYGGALTDFLTGTLSIDSNGLSINTGVNVTMTAAGIALFAGDYTIYCELSDNVPVAAANTGVIGFSAVDGPIYLLPRGQARSFHTNSAGSVDSQYRSNPYAVSRICMSQGATAGRSIIMDGSGAVATKTNTTNHPAPSAVALGQFNGGSYLNGYIRRLAIWKSKGSDANLKILSKPTLTTTLGLDSTGYIRGLPQEKLTVGANKFQYEHTQAWTAWALVKCIGQPDASGTWPASIIFTNVSTSTIFPGYELWIEGGGRLDVRVINDISTHMIEVRGTTNVCDGAWHVVSATYDGSGAASGVKIYVDGVLETMTTVADTLGGNSIVSGTQTYLIGNQTLRLDYPIYGFMGAFRFYDAAKDQTWQTANAAALPISSDAVLSYNMDQTTTTVVDLSPSAFNGTLSTIDMSGQ